MKLAFITHNFPVDEIERSNAGIFVSDLVKELAQSGHMVSVFVVNSVVTKKKVLQNGKIKVFFLGQGGLKKSLGHVKAYNLYDLARVINLFVQSRKELYRLMSKEKFDFCIACWAIPSGVLAYLVCRTLKIPYGIWALGSDIYVYQKYPFLGSLIKAAVNKAKLLLADGVNLAKIVEKLNHQKCTFLPSATNFSTNKEIPTLINKKQKNFVFLGRMEKVKGPDVFLEALNLLPRNQNYHAYFLGGGVMYKKIEKMMYKYRLEENVTLLGNIDDTNLIYSYLKNADSLIIPSRSDSIPLVLTESAKAGTPVVVSDVGDLSYLVNKYNLGRTFPSEDFEKLFRILRYLITSTAKNKDMKTELKRFADEFEVKQTAKSLIILIKKQI